jgi:hypothetical protein
MWLLSALLVVLFSGGSLFAQEEKKAEGTDPVESARDGLARGKFNWYDTVKDDLKRIEVKPPVNPTQNTGNPNVGAAAASGLQMLAWVFVAAVLAIVAWFLIQAFLRLETGGKDNTAAQGTVVEVDRTEALPIPIERNISDLLAAARKAYDAGDYRQAIVYLYSHQLVELDKHHVIHLTKGKTNGQYLREVIRAGRKALAGVLGVTQDLFEQAFFGNRALAPEQFEPCWASLPEFDRMLREAPR